MRILIAEDDRISRIILQKYLLQYGECDIAVDGLQTLDAFLAALEEQNPYNLICLDIMMPNLDGMKVLKAIRDIEKQKKSKEDYKLKIIMMTALNDKKTVKECYDMGCDAYLWKPLDFDKLKEVLYNLGLVR